MRTRIGHKIAAAVSGAAVVITGLFAFMIHSAHQEQLLADLERSAHQLSETIKSSTRHDMLLNQRESVHRIINTIGNQEGIEKVRIFNKEGSVILSTDPLDVGGMVDQQAEACYICHAADKPLERVPVSERTRIFEVETGEHVFGIINPIYNEPSCWTAACHAHDSTKKVLGVLDITMSMAAVDQSKTLSQRRAILFSLVAVVAISFIIHSLVTRIVLRPVRRIVEGTERVAAGDLQHPVELGKQDEIGRLAKSFNDMTQQLALAQRQVIQSNKLSSVGRLAAGVAHEINNPLTGVLTYSSFLLKQAEDQPEMKEDLEVIVRETKRCRDIVKGLLDFSRQSVTEKRHVKVNDFVKSACKIVQHQLSLQHTDIDLKLEANLPPILADQNQMQQVLVNLIVNAADAYPEGGGAVTVETTLVSNDTSKIRVRVVDTGCGIPEERIDKIFEPFYSTKGGKGTGLGLAIAWGIVEAHNGVFTVNSEPGRGTTFDITLPLADRGGTP